jgi:hypothetical protein
LPEAALDHGARDEKRDDDEEDRAVGESRVRLPGSERAREHRRCERQHGGREDRERVDDDGEDRRREQGEKVPRGRGQPCGDGAKPDPRGDRKSRHAGHDLAAQANRSDSITASIVP